MFSSRLLPMLSNVHRRCRHRLPPMSHFHASQSTAKTNTDNNLNIAVPKNGVKFSFSRSSGKGGQNVNKVSTRATLRFHVDSANWLPLEERERLRQQNSNRIGKDGDFSLSSEAHRTQPRNIDDCMQRLQKMVTQACIEPKERVKWTGLGKETKKRRKESKRRRSDVKKSRGKNKKFDF